MHQSGLSSDGEVADRRVGLSVLGIGAIADGSGATLHQHQKLHFGSGHVGVMQGKWTRGQYILPPQAVLHDGVHLGLGSLFWHHSGTH